MSSNRGGKPAGKFLVRGSEGQALAELINAAAQVGKAAGRGANFDAEA